MRGGVQGTPEISEWLIQQVPEGGRVGIDPFLHTIEAARKLKAELEVPRGEGAAQSLLIPSPSPSPIICPLPLSALRPLCDPPLISPSCFISSSLPPRPNTLLPPRSLLLGPPCFLPPSIRFPPVPLDICPLTRPVTRCPLSSCFPSPPLIPLIVTPAPPALLPSTPLIF